jgi:endonuclease YncB( thermonuclease family)
MRPGKLLRLTKRRSLGSTLLLLLALSAWQYFDQGRISWHEDLVRELSGDTRPARQRNTTAAVTLPPPGKQLSGTVDSVTDGDTLKLVTTDLNEYRIRLYGIDAPERDQPYGDTAALALDTLVDDRQITVKIQDIDDYGRLVSTVYLEGNNINVVMVREGHAWWYRYFSKSDTTLADAEAAARTARAGLWARARPVAPWEWRRRKKQ